MTCSLRIEVGRISNQQLTRRKCRTWEACAARLELGSVRPLSFLPPLILVPGARPSQLAKCLLVGKAVRWAPVSDTTAIAVVLAR